MPGPSNPYTLLTPAQKKSKRRPLGVSQATWDKHNFGGML